MRLRLPLLTIALCIPLAGCPDSGGQGPLQNDRDTMTRRQRDSVTATLPIRGSGGVGGALDAQDAARARAAELDSLLGGGR
jgi:hypothetical protein